MLYQTQPSTSLSISSFHFFHHLSLTLQLQSSFLPFPSLSPSQAVTEMECVQETALKSSFRKQLTPQTFLEDLSVFNAQNITSTDDFFVDDLLNFSHEQHEEEEEEEALLQEQQPQPQQQKQNQSHQIHEPSFNDDNHFGSLPTNELSVPVEEAANLEWLSYFVEDSFSEFSNSFPTAKVAEEKAPEPKSTFSTPCFKTPIPAKARSKRTRTGVRVWPLKSTSLADSSSTSSSNNTTLSSSSTSSSMLICITNLEQFSKPPEKNTKRKASADGEGRGGGVGHVLPRRCTHCGVQKTPQWRTGPLGAKTLCNACGVRYKSGRLLPEYRPACSPTFSSELHSNHHRKVLEMRRKKDGESGPETDSVIPGF